jgi:Flp pilus assembly protein TadD
LSPNDNPDTPILLQQAFDAHRRADLIEAERLYRAVLEAQPGESRALANLGALELQRGRPAEALAWLDRALAIRPDQPAALQAVRRAVSLDPGYADGLNTEGLLLIELGFAEQALAPLEKAVALTPGQPVYANSLGIALTRLARPEDALIAFERALSAAPDYVEARSNHAAALRAVGRLKEALAACEALLAVHPGHVDAGINRACVLRELGRHDEALQSLQALCAAAPGHVEAEWTLALELLAAGRWTEGWPRFEWRWRRPDFQPLVGRFEGPPWLGQTPLEGKTLLLHYEQGLGDTIQMLRYLAPIAEQGAKVILAVQPPLVPLVKGLPGVAQVLTDGDPPPAYDLHCPLMSLPLAFGTRPDTVPWRGPYLSAPGEAKAAWRARLANLPRPRIGLAWSGNLLHLNDRNRSVALDALKPLLETPAGFVSLQKAYRDGDRERLAALGLADVSGDLHDFADTAGLIAALDLVITVDTSVAHLAGAMGKPVLLLLPFAPDFRWLHEGESTPWYPSMRLLRQTAPGDWSGPIRQAAEAIAAF